MAKHYCKVFVELDATTLSLLMQCTRCGDHTISLPVTHIATLARVFADIAERTGLMSGETVKIPLSVSKLEALNSDPVQEEIEAVFRGFINRRTEGES